MHIVLWEHGKIKEKSNNGVKKLKVTNLPKVDREKVLKLLKNKLKTKDFNI